MPTDRSLETQAAERVAARAAARDLLRAHLPDTREPVPMPHDPKAFTSTYNWPLLTPKGRMLRGQARHGRVRLAGGGERDMPLAEGVEHMLHSAAFVFVRDGMELDTSAAGAKGAADDRNLCWSGCGLPGVGVHDG